MRFLISTRTGINESNADEYQAKLCDVWYVSTFYTPNDIDKTLKAQRDDQGNIILDKNGEPKMKSVSSIIEAKPPKDWNEVGYDHKLEKIEPIYDPNYGTGGWVTITGNKRSSDGIPDSGALKGERKIKNAMYAVEFEDFGHTKEFIKYILEHDFSIQESDYHWCDYTLNEGDTSDSDICYMFYQSWNEYDYN